MDLEQIEKLIAEEKWEEAKSLLREYLASASTEQERGEYFVQVASVYLRVMNKIKEQQAALLEDSVNILREFDVKEGEMQQNKDIHDAQARLEEAYKK